MQTEPDIEPDRIDTHDKAASAQGAKKFDVTEMQLHDAVKVVGDKATDVELHLKGTLSTSNADRVGGLDRN